MLVDKDSTASRVAKRMGKREQRWNDPDAHRALKKLYEERVVPTGMTQEQFGAMYGIGTQGMVWQYLSGTTPLSLEAAARFARGLKCTIYEISPSMAEELKTEIMPVLGPKSWWRLGGKAAMIALVALLVLPPAPAHASFSVNVAAFVYYVKSLFRKLLARFQHLRTLRVARA